MYYCWFYFILTAQYWACSFTGGDWDLDQTGLKNNRIWNLFLGNISLYNEIWAGFSFGKTACIPYYLFYPLWQRQAWLFTTYELQQTSRKYFKVCATYFLSTKNLMYCKAPASAAIQDEAAIDYFCCCCLARRKICNFDSLATAFHSLFSSTTEIPPVLQLKIFQY